MIQGTWCASSDDFEEFNWRRYERIVLCYDDNLQSQLALALLVAQAIRKPTSLVAVLPPVPASQQGKCLDAGVRTCWQEAFFASSVKSLGREYAIPVLIVHADNNVALTAAAVAAAIPASAITNSSGEVCAVEGGWMPLRLSQAALTVRPRPRSAIVAGIGGVAFLMLLHWVEVWQPARLVLLGRKKPNQMNGKLRRLREKSRRRTVISYCQVVNNSATRKWGDNASKDHVESAYESVHSSHSAASSVHSVCLCCRNYLKRHSKKTGQNGGQSTVHSISEGN